VHPNVERVLAALAELGCDARPIELPKSTRTAPEAAEAIGTSVGQIVKSLVFDAGGAPVLVAASGSNRVSVEKLGSLAGTPVRRADADLVRKATGFSIGGVPPVALARRLRVLVDRDLMRYTEVWAAAGMPNAVFPIEPEELVRITGGEVVDIGEE
jgi:prolyl-tRNA editing enzyme YbaK/EbsC (Cys-tRNA(Pro) deacylase)